MRPLRWLAHVITTRFFWTMRLATLPISLYLIWRIHMTDYIAMTPTEFIPVLLAIAVVTALLFTYIKAVPAFDDMNKEKLRAGTITEKIKYGMDYLIANITSFVVAVAAGVFVPGVIYVSGLHTEPELYGCAILAFLIAMIVGYGGTAVLTTLVDTFRDKAKIAELVKDNKQN